jgi:hypothetical protein
MTMQSYFRENLLTRLQQISDELEFPRAHCFEVFGDGNNVLYNILGFASKKGMLQLFFMCGFSKENKRLATKTLKKNISTLIGVMFTRVPPTMTKCIV